MITLERVTSENFPGQVWTDETNTHVIVEETADTVRLDIPMSPGWYVRDEDGERGPVPTFAGAFGIASGRWGGEVALGPALRLERDIAHRDGAQFLLEYLAEYGPVGIDVKDMAEGVLTRAEGP